MAVSVIAYPEPLRYLLGARSDSTADTAQLMALLDYFERGVPLP